MLFRPLGLPFEFRTRNASFVLTAYTPSHPEQSLWSHRVEFDDSYTFGVFSQDSSNDVVSVSRSANGGDITHTDFCTTKILQPLFLTMRNSLATALRVGSLGQGVSLKRSGL